MPFRDVQVDVPFDLKLTATWCKKNKNKVIKAGTQTLDGKMITEFIHERHSLKNGDYGRQLQEAALAGIAKSVLKPSSLPHLPALANSISDFLIATNMSTSDMPSLGLAVNNLDAKDIQYHQLNGESKTMNNDVLKANDLEIVLDQDNMKEIASKYYLD
jgi:polyisoprenyl-teichoic acid--peptidoglycan teichoic acid transferase